MSEHTKEPWVCNENEFDEYIWGPNREMIAESRGTGGGLPQFENRRRIVACVNACAGISTEKLEEQAKDPIAGMFGRMASKAQTAQKKAEKQRDEALAALESVLCDNKACGNNIGGITEKTYKKIYLALGRIKS